MHPAVVAVVAAAVVFLAVCRDNPAAAVATVVYDGLQVALAFLSLTVGGLAVRGPTTAEPRSLTLVTGLGIGIAFAATVGLLLGLAGWLNFGTAVSILALPGLLGGGIVWLQRDRWKRPARQPHPMRWLWVLLGLPAGAAVAAACLPAGVLWGDEPHGYDVVSYHLQIPREWFALGQVVPLEHNVFSHMPLANEVLFLLAMHVARDEYAAQYAIQFLNVGLMAAVVFATYAVARSAESTSVAAACVAVVVASVPWAVLLGSIAYNEPLAMFGSALAAAFVLQRSRSASLVCGVFAGMAAAAKYTAWPMIVVPIVATALYIRRPLAAALTLAGIGITAGPWLVRNMIWFGNPVSPLVSMPWTDVQAERWQDAHDVGLAEAPRQVLVELLLNGRFGFLLPILLACAAVYGIRRRSRPAIVATCWLGFGLLVWIFGTHMIGRFLVLLVGPAAMLLAVLPWRKLWPVAIVAAIVGVGWILFAGGTVRSETGVRHGLWTRCRTVPTTRWSSSAAANCSGCTKPTARPRRQPVFAAAF